MNDTQDMIGDTQEKAPVKRASKNNSKPGKRPQKSGVEASRISYKQRRTVSANDRDPDFHYRVFNADNEKYAGRLEEAQRMGYIFANDGESLGDEAGIEASSIGSNVGRHVGHGTRGVLMKIPKNYYEEDMAAKQAEVDETEMGMVDDELKNASDMYGEGLKVADSQGSRLEMKVRK